MAFQETPSTIDKGRDCPRFESNR